MTSTASRGERAGVEVSWQTLAYLVDIARRAGQAILARRDAAAEMKGDGSPVTAADRAAQAIVEEALIAWDAAVPIIAEEMELPDPAVRRTWTRYWLVDPLDGTKEFLAGLPEFTVNIALIDRGEPVLGVIDAPALDIVYFAARGLGAWRQIADAPAVRIHARAPDPGAGLRIVESRSHPSPRLESFLSERLVCSRTHIGSSLKFCRLAEGSADCYPRFGPTMAWDVAAGDCIFRNAAPDFTRHASPLTYDPVNLRQPEFVMIVMPDADANAGSR
jgi:3'(2'), 5'-bisphosphate nucleotidase